MFHDVAALPHVALRDGGDHPVMVVIFAHTAAGRDVPCDSQRSLRNELTEQFAQRAVSGDIGKSQMEIAGQADGIAVFSGVDKSVLAGCDIGQDIGILRRAFAGRFGDDAVFKQTPGFEYLPDFVRFRRGDDCTAVRSVLHHFVERQAQQDLTDDGAADAENIA